MIREPQTAPEDPGAVPGRQLLRGYLDEPYRIFHLSGAPQAEVPFHYHEFFKILALLHGKIGYEIEGRRYELMPGDLVLVRPGEMHRPVVHAQEAYERVILYLSDGILIPFPHIRQNGERKVLRPGSRNLAPVPPGTQREDSAETSPEDRPRASYPHGEGERERRLHAELGGALLRLPLASDAACAGYENGKLLQNCRLTEFLLLLNESMKEQVQDICPVSQNENVRRAIDYIGAHIVEELTVDGIARAVHLNRSYLMHVFRAETGYTLKEFITEKRLFIAGSLMRRGLPLTQVCYQSGFGNYSSFYRAWQRRFGASPRAGQENAHALPGTDLPVE